MTDDRRTDAELLAASHTDEAAFTALVRRYVRSATLLAAQLLGDNDDAEDVVQDAFAVVYRNASTFDVQRPFGPWIYSIVRRLSSNRRAREMRRGRLLRLFATESRTQTRSLDTAVAARLDAERARRAMEELSPMQRACFELVVIRGFPIEEVAAMHSVSESTVRQHVFRARSALRGALGSSNG